MNKLTFNPSAEQESDFDYKKYFDDCFVDISEDIPFPPVALSIGKTDYRGTMYDNPTFTYGEISLIKAKKKSKKTFLKTALAACYIGGQASAHFPNIKSRREGNKYVFDFDTEQGPYYSVKAFRRVMEMTRRNYENYMPFGIERISNKAHRLEFIDHIVSDPKYKGKIGMLVIDHIADLVRNPNDVVETDKAIQYLMKWKREGMHILCIIHTRSEDNKARGHLGTFIEEKCETVILVERTDPTVKNDPVRVTQPDARGPEFDEFHFKLNNNVIPYECDIKEEEIW